VAVIEVSCVCCSSTDVVRNGKSITEEQRYRCCAIHCGKTVQLFHRYTACEKGVRERMVDMALNGSGVRDTARVLSVGVSTVINTLKKKQSI